MIPGISAGHGRKLRHNLKGEETRTGHAIIQCFGQFAACAAVGSAGKNTDTGHHAGIRRKKLIGKKTARR